jgi:hypothetical protein
VDEMLRILNHPGMIDLVGRHASEKCEAKPEGAPSSKELEAELEGKIPEATSEGEEAEEDEEDEDDEEEGEDEDDGSP